MWRVKNGEASESAEGICTVCFDARLGRHASLVRLAWEVESQNGGSTSLGLRASLTSVYIVCKSCEQASVASRSCRRIL